MPDRPKSLLVVAYYYPPDAAVGGRRIARFCKHLPEFGIAPTVLTIDDDSREQLDKSLVPPGEAELFKVAPHATPLAWNQKKKSALSLNGSTPAAVPQATAPPKRGWLKNNIIALLAIPDLQWGWYLPAGKFGIGLGAKRQFDAVLSSGPPWTAHAVGRKIARELQVPWIADFRDGWNWDPWRPKGWPLWRRKLDAHLETSWLRGAARIICTTDRSRLALLDMHPELPAEIAVTISNGIDPVEGSTSPPTMPRRNKRVLLHAGNLYANRRISSFCAAVEQLQKGNDYPFELEIRFLGRNIPRLEADARAATPKLFESGVMKFLPPVPWQEARSEQANADVLLIFQGDHANAIPAKFFEYLQTGKPILGIVGEGALRDLIHQTGSGTVADPTDIGEIVCALKSVLKMEPRPAAEIERVLQPFYSRNLTAQLAKEISEVTR